MARSPAQRVIGTLLFLAALVAIAGFYFVVFAESQQINTIPGVGELNLVAIAVAILLAIVALVLIILLASRGRQRMEADDDHAYFVPPEPAPVKPYPAFEEVDDDLVVYDVWRLPLAKRSWATEERGLNTFYFPLHVDGGVYVNDYIPIDAGGRRLKLRTLLAGPPDVEAAAFTIPAAARHEARARRMESPRRPERPERVDERRPERPQREVPGDHFMRELERRFNARDESKQVAVATEAAYYDFPGEEHDVAEVEGIGGYAQRLRNIGIRSTARLCYEDAASIGRQLDVPKATVESWQAMAQLMKVSGIGPQYAEALVRAGIDMESLRRRSPDQLAAEVNRHLGELGVEPITERRVASWQTAARAMRRVRLRVPEQ